MGNRVNDTIKRMVYKVTMRSTPGPIIGFRVPSEYVKRTLADQARTEGKTLSDLMREFLYDGLERRNHQDAERRP